MTWAPETIPLLEEALKDPAPDIDWNSELTTIIEFYNSALRVFESGSIDVWEANKSILNMNSKTSEQVSEHLFSQVLPGVRILVSSVRSVSSALESYASELFLIHSAADRLRQEVQDLFINIADARAQINTIKQRLFLPITDDWREVPSSGLGFYLDFSGDSFDASLAHTWENTAVAWQRALDAIEEKVQEWHMLRSRREQVEAELVGSIRKTDLRTIGLVAKTGGFGLQKTLAITLTGFYRGKSLTDIFAPRENNKQTAELRGSANKHLIFSAKLARDPRTTAKVQNKASTHLLHHAILKPEVATALIGFDSKTHDSEQFRLELLDLYRTWQQAKDDAAFLAGSPEVHLLQLGSHEGRLTAAISYGNIDQASHVTVNVSGMFSKASNMSADASGAKALYEEATTQNKNVRFAAVAWLGYKSPGLVGVNTLHSAEKAAPRLAQFIDGIHNNASKSGVQIQNLSLTGHSYGSIVSSEALSLVKNRVDNFIAYGGPGVSATSDLSLLNVENIYALQAKGDQVSSFGVATSSILEKGYGQTRNLLASTLPFGSVLKNILPKASGFTHTANLVDLPGVTRLSAEASGSFARVTSHDMHTEDTKATLLNWAGKSGYLTSGTFARNQIGAIISGNAETH